MSDKARNYGLVTSVQELGELVDMMLERNLPIGFDIETGYSGHDRPSAAVHPEEGFIVGISFTNSTEWARYVPLRHDRSENMDETEAARQFWRLLTSGLGVAHNAKFERRFLSVWFRSLLSDDAEYGPQVRESRGYFPVRSDTMIEAYLSGKHQSVGLKALTKSLFGHEQAEFTSLFPPMAKNKQKTLRFNTLELTPQVVSYACEDAAWCLALHEHFYPLVSQMLLYRVEMQIMVILCEMEEYGVLYDWAAMEKFRVEGEIFLNKQNEEIQAELSKLLGTAVSINLGSPKQVGDILYNALGMKTPRKSSTGAMSTDAIAMSALAKEHPVVAKMLEWKEIKTLITRYLTKYPIEYNYAADGFAHPDHLQTVVPAGRFAVSNPAYQQSPKYYKYETSDGSSFEMNFRDFIIAPPEHYILGFDYSQIELRMMAGVSGEPTLMAAFDNDEDVHAATAALMLNLPADQVTSADRSVGKTMNFALLYGMGIKSLAERLNLPREEAQRLYNQYFSAYSAISVWVERAAAEGKKNQYASTLFGRRVPIWEFQSENSAIRSKGERLCVNAPIQGAAADYMKIAMVRTDEALRKAGMKDRVHLVMNIHDALEFYVHESLSPEEVIDVLRPAVEFAVPGLPKIVAEWHVGQKWGSVTEFSYDSIPSAPQRPLMEQDSPTDAVAESVDADEQVDVPLSVSTVVGADSATTVVVEISSMPTTTQYEKWLDLLDAHPGDNLLILRTPQGDLEYDDVRTSLTPSSGAEVSMIFGSAHISYTQESVNLDALADGIV